MKKRNLIVFLFVAIILSPFYISAKESKKVILVLGSGGSKGLAHVGVLEELENLGVVPDVIVGCSSGSIIGALYAQHKDINLLKTLFMNMKYDDLVDFSIFQKYAVSTREKVENFLHENLTATDFSQLEIKFIAVATDLHKGEPVYFQKGDLHGAVLASSALPALFAPYQMGDQTYVDGGITDPLPTQFAQTLEKNAVIIASDITPSLDGFEADNLPQVIRKSFEVMYQRLSGFSQKEADVLLEMNFMDMGSPIEDGANQETYEKGKQSVKDHAEEILKAISK